MEIVAFFREGLPVYKEIKRQNKYAEELQGMNEHICVLVREKGSLFIKRIVGKFNDPHYPYNKIIYVESNNVLIDFVDLMIDDVFATAQERTYTKDIASIELSTGVYDSEITNELLRYIGTMLEILTFSMYIKTIASNMVITDHKGFKHAEELRVHVGVVREGSIIHRLFESSKDYVASHPNEAVWLTPNYYMKFKEVNLQNPDYEETSNVFVEHV